MRASALRYAVLGVAFGGSACSWSRFDELTDSSPVVLLDRPAALTNGFGVSLATASNQGKTQLLVGGTVTASAAALYEIGQPDAPGLTAIDTNYCSSDEQPCSLSSLTAGFANAQAPDTVRPLCFAVGSGKVVDLGLVVRCQDDSEYTLRMPQTAQDLLAQAITQDKPRDFPLATDRGQDPVLLASLPEQHLAWFYPQKSLTFSELLLPNGTAADDSTFGKSLAVLAVDGGHVLALGVSGKSQVFLWKTVVGATDAHYLGCLGGRKGMGRALSSGKVNSDGSDDLVVSDESQVQVIDGAELFKLPETTSSECSLSSLLTGATLGSFVCGSTSDVSGCETSEFGAALAVGDLDGDGDGEVIVGAPKMTVRGEENAGALLVYDADAAAFSSLVEAKFMSSAEGEDQLGRTIVAPHVGKRDIIAAGAPGHGKAALFYCSALLAAGKAGSRCP
ncbi:MAG TPA: hypothetical protein VFK05_21380 [Polyangiaceae bacterium]|nr:hypothetical protein [Polyangiaceae bacterium]